MIRVLAALGGFAGVGLGAFGAHAITDPQARAWIATATTYGLTHAAVVLWAADRHRWPAWLLIAGSLIFSATLYAMALGAPRWLGAVAPIGGALMMAGWLWLLLAVRRS